jgi:hypothetical protein
MTKRKKDERTNNDLQNITHKTKDRATPTPLKTGGERRCSGRVDKLSLNCNKRDILKRGYTHLRSVLRVG